MDLRNQYSDCILFFRMWDFYETFYEDAKTCAKLLDLTLTARDKHGANPVPMAWVPYHAADKYIAKLVAFGHKVAIAEQMSEPKAGQIVERQVTQVVTPATFIQESEKEYTYMAAITYTWWDSANYQCAWWDVTVGMYMTHSFATLDDLLHHIKRLQPREVVVDIDFPERITIREQITQTLPSCLVSTYDKPADSQALLRAVLWVQTLTSFGKALEQGREHAMWLLCNYVQHVQPHALQTIVRVQYDAQQHAVMMDMVTIKNLELVVSQYDTNKKYSLLWVLDTTVTALGARLFKEILLHPTQDAQVLQHRHATIADYAQRSWDAKHIQETLRTMLDMPKIIATLLYKKTTPTIFGKLRYALSLIYTNDAILHEVSHIGRTWWLHDDHIAAGKKLYETLHTMLKYEWLNDDIDYITDWYDAQIDELRQIAYHSDGMLLAYQQELVQATGVANIKVKYITNQWYVLEVTPKDEANFEAASRKWDEKFEFIRRQTLKTGQRYTTIYLDELQRKVLSAQFQLRSREQLLIDDAKALLLSVVAALQQIADAVAWLDVYTSHALFALHHKYTQPHMWWNLLAIVDGRHPVIEEFLPHDQDFIPNNLVIGSSDENIDAASISDWEDIATKKWWDTNTSDERLHIITWPNMWGKSTFLRQNALIVLMAHCGLFVPAQSAKIPLVDGLFARVGSWDVIAKNQSTFMTEMIEMANILHNATKNSFIILDELWRGTSTYDGMALAHAIVQYIVQHIGAKTLFATHYHELIALENTLPWTANYSVSVYETEKDVVFMKKIVRGWANKSYWLDVAKIAGIPHVIVDTAKKYLAFHEQEAMSHKESGLHAAMSHTWSSQATSMQPTSMPLFAMGIDRESINAKTELDRIKRLLDTLDPNNMTPMQALQMIGKLKGEV